MIGAKHPGKAKVLDLCDEAFPTEPVETILPLDHY
jgi:hypothetical protein